MKTIILHGAAPVPARGRIAPNGSAQGTGLPFARYGALSSTGVSATPSLTRDAIRMDARVPEPRGRQL